MIIVTTLYNAEKYKEIHIKKSSTQTKRRRGTPHYNEQQTWEKLMDDLPDELTNERYERIDEEIETYHKYIEELHRLKKKYQSKKLTLTQFCNVHNLVPLSKQEKQDFKIPFMDDYDYVAPEFLRRDEGHFFDATNYKLYHILDVVNDLDHFIGMFLYDDDKWIEQWYNEDNRQSFGFYDKITDKRKWDRPRKGKRVRDAGWK